MALLSFSRAFRITRRVRPPGTTGDDSFPCVDFGDNGQIGLINPKDQRQSVYAFDKVFEGPTTQEMVYLETQPLIRSVVDGYNVCIFAYGQTGSGKTHTMSGTDIAHSSGRGINYRALDDLFDLQHQRSNEVMYDIKVQMLEVYNEKVRSRVQIAMSFLFSPLRWSC
jgi:kinesin family member C2/C3